MRPVARLFLIWLSMISTCVGLIAPARAEYALDCTNHLSALRVEHAEYAYTSAGQRKDARAWLQLKSLKNSAPRTIDLTAPDSSQISPLLSFWFSANKSLQFPGTPAPTMYEQRVLDLREGDTVIFHDRKFTLGKFLGAGNATHIFEIKDRPNLVLRIPFLAGFLTRPVHDAPSLDRLSRIKHYMKLFTSKIEYLKNHVKVFDTNGSDYAVVEKVNGHENANEFLARYLDPRYREQTPARILWPRDFISRIAIPSSELLKIRSLADLMLANLHADIVLSSGEVSIRAYESRQYMWDDVKNRWYVMDAE